MKNLVQFINEASDSDNFANRFIEVFNKFENGGSPQEIKEKDVKFYYKEFKKLVSRFQIQKNSSNSITKYFKDQQPIIMLPKNYIESLSGGTFGWDCEILIPVSKSALTSYTIRFEKDRDDKWYVLSDKADNLKYDGLDKEFDKWYCRILPEDALERIQSELG